MKRSTFLNNGSDENFNASEKGSGETFFASSPHIIDVNTTISKDGYFAEIANVDYRDHLPFKENKVPLSYFSLHETD